MFTSDTERMDAVRRWLKADAAWTLLCAVFSAVYEAFSHDVISLWMVLLFLFPLLGGVLPAAICLKRNRAPQAMPLALWRSGTAILGVGSCIRGVLAIYGTTSNYQMVYWVAGTAMLAAGALLSLHRPRQTA